MTLCLACVKGNVDETAATYKRVAAFDPSYYLALGWFYVEHQMDDAAAVAFQEAFDHPADAVALANSSAWIVNYYYDHGQKARAFAIAKFAADVYSCSGLQTMASLQERMGNFDQAESYFQQIKERYNDATPLILFYGRHQKDSREPDYSARLNAAIGTIFPTGIKSVTLADFKTPPAKGVLIAGENDLLRRSGLKRGGIIVALDGSKAEDFVQYSYIRDLTKSPQMDFIVFQDGKYQAVRASVPNRRFNLDFHSWPQQ